MQGYVDPRASACKMWTTLSKGFSKIWTHVPIFVASFVIQSATVLHFLYACCTCTLQSRRSNSLHLAISVPWGPILNCSCWINSMTTFESTSRITFLNPLFQARYNPWATPCNSMMIDIAIPTFWAAPISQFSSWSHNLFLLLLGCPLVHHQY